MPNSLQNMVDWLAGFGPDYESGDGKIAIDIAQRLIDLQQLADIAMVLHKDVSDRLNYNGRKCNLTSVPKLPLSIAFHYQKEFEERAKNLFSSSRLSQTISFVTTRGEHEKDTK